MKSRIVGVSLPEGTIKKIKAAADKQHRSVSGLLRSIILEAIGA